MKHDRIALRASEKERDRLIEAAAYTGMSLSAFLRQAALEKSDDVLKSRDILTLSDKDRDIFLEALENPPKPNKRLQQAFVNYRKQKSKGSAPVPTAVKRSRHTRKRTKAAAGK